MTQKNLSHVVIVAGGTGGHVFPALAVANILRQQSVRVSWIGTRKGIESRLVPEHGIPIEWLEVQGLRGKGTLKWLTSPFKVTKSILQCRHILKRLQPDCVLGMGGYTAGPGGVAAKTLGIPLVVHEQNAVAGLTNRLLAKIANRCLTGFKQVSGFSSKSIWVGNPVRESIEQLGEQIKTVNSPVNVLVVGGSQGAAVLNQALPPLLSSMHSKIQVWHQSGKSNADDVKEQYRSLNMEVRVTEFIEDMAAAYQWADLLICRAGAMTIAECCAAAKAAIFVPFAYAAGDHQTINANVLVRDGAALMLRTQDLVDGDFEQAKKLLSEPEKITSMAEKARAHHRMQAAQKVAEHCYCAVGVKAYA